MDSSREAYNLDLPQRSSVSSLDSRQAQLEPCKSPDSVNMFAPQHTGTTFTPKQLARQRSVVNARFVQASYPNAATKATLNPG